MHTATGLASGVARSEMVLEQITTSVLLKSSVDNADKIFLSITAAEGARPDVIDKIASVLREKASPDAIIFYGMDFDNTMDVKMKVMLIATKHNRP